MALIYCVEDDEGIRELTSCALKSGGYEVVGFKNSEDFKSALAKKAPSLILLDIMLPEEDGVSILKWLRSSEFSNIAVIMLTAKASEVDKVTALEEGADDYITKPFGVMELLSRVKAVMRRTIKETESEVLSKGKLSVSIQKHIVSYDGQEVSLTFREFELLVFMLRNKDLVLTREKLMDKVWGFDFEGESRTVDMHIKTLRKKLEAVGCHDFITTVRGVGYKI